MEVKNLPEIMTEFDFCEKHFFLQRTTDQTSRLSVIMHELKTADTALYRKTLMALVNSILNCTEDIRTRNMIRNEFIGMVVNHGHLYLIHAPRRFIVKHRFA